jgi:hypothetical protein
VGRYLRKSRENLVAELLYEISLSELLNWDLSTGVLSLVDLEQLLKFSPGRTILFHIGSLALL